MSCHSPLNHTFARKSLYPFTERSQFLHHQRTLFREEEIDKDSRIRAKTIRFLFYAIHKPFHTVFFACINAYVNRMDFPTLLKQFFNVVNVDANESVGGIEHLF